MARDDCGVGPIFETPVSDVFTPDKRSEVMSRIRATNTKPEIAVRRALHALGYRFRLHVAGLPGKPDIVMRRHMTVVQVNGCFWHGHRCLKGRRPRQNATYWGSKIAGNIERDRRNERQLRAAGWKVRTLWECDVRRWDHEQLRRRLLHLLPTRNATEGRRSVR